MAGKVSVVIERDGHGCYAWCPELKGCQSQGRTVEETLAKLSREILLPRSKLMPKLPRLWGRLLTCGGLSTRLPRSSANAAQAD